MAKAVASVYRPGRRSPAWKKIKPDRRTAAPRPGNRAVR